MTLRDWYRVRCDDAGIHLDVEPPGREAWQADIAWADIVRVCFKAEDLTLSDGWYVFTSRRPESYVIPTEFDGGDVLLDEFLKRKLFDADQAIRAAAGAEGDVFCWPLP